MQGHYCQILNKYDQMLIQYDQNDQKHIELFQERNCLEIQESNAKNTWFWVEVDWGIEGIV